MFFLITVKEETTMDRDMTYQILGNNPRKNRRGIDLLELPRLRLRIQHARVKSGVRDRMEILPASGRYRWMVRLREERLEL